MAAIFLILLLAGDALSKMMPRRSNVRLGERTGVGKRAAARARGKRRAINVRSSTARDTLAVSVAITRKDFAMISYANGTCVEVRLVITALICIFLQRVVNSRHPSMTALRSTHRR